MRGIAAVLAGFMLMVSSAGASTPPIDYEKVDTAGVQRMMGQWVRYIMLSGDSPCITLQIFRFANMEGLVRQKRICSLGKMSFRDDFAFVDVRKIEFEPDRLSLEVEFFSLRGSGDEVRECSIDIGNGSIGDLKCSLEFGSEFY
ncbi:MULTISPECIES: hypothetical protein [Stenotrophomonas]|nr:MULTISPECIES: hypothetical protein [Stenotrophomonas]ELC7324405.1 hypothetical protein [Stenotrophomonas maltophilia]MBH1661606.1 hypothetical protein [Stenotrophomonas maltophilia]MBH1735489.1 hypothetical protein [Stenotrophomonas maltophilia]MBH1769688.1 hypothetical protein [Stenotrophomonas maltophilia]MDZ5834409.1 hypothetical protein [Stenotrophomonas maltophilia]